MKIPFVFSFADSNPVNHLGLYDTYLTFPGFLGPCELVNMDIYYPLHDVNNQRTDISNPRIYLLPNQPFAMMGTATTVLNNTEKGAYTNIVSCINTPDMINGLFTKEYQPLFFSPSTMLAPNQPFASGMLDVFPVPLGIMRTLLSALNTSYVPYSIIDYVNERDVRTQWDSLIPTDLRYATPANPMSLAPISLSGTDISLFWTRLSLRSLLTSLISNTVMGSFEAQLGNYTISAERGTNQGMNVFFSSALTSVSYLLAILIDESFQLNPTYITNFFQQRECKFALFPKGSTVTSHSRIVTLVPPIDLHNNGGLGNCVADLNHDTINAKCYIRPLDLWSLIDDYDIIAVTHSNNIITPA